MADSGLLNLVPPTARGIAAQLDLSPQAQELLARGLSSSDYVKALVEQDLNSDAVGFLANGLKQRQGVQWAAESASMVSDKLPPEEVVWRFYFMVGAFAHTVASCSDIESESGGVCRLHEPEPLLCTVM